MARQPSYCAVSAVLKITARGSNQKAAVGECTSSHAYAYIAAIGCAATAVCLGIDE
jgi:hypothetical protein